MIPKKPKVIIITESQFKRLMDILLKEQLVSSKVISEDIKGKRSK